MKFNCFALLVLLLFKIVAVCNNICLSTQFKVSKCRRQQDGSAGKDFATKPDDLSLITGAHMLEENYSL